MPTVLITGCDSGIGREFARQYAAANWRVFATYRRLDDPLHISGIEHLPLDVTRAEDFLAVKQSLGGEAIDLLISNAGVGRDPTTFGAIDYDQVNDVLAVNLIGPLRLLETFIDEVAASERKRIVLISSRMGSIGLNITGDAHVYRASKAALNALGRSLAVSLAPRGVRLTMLHPGWVRSAAGGDNAALSPAQSVTSMRQLIDRLGNHESGDFLSYDGRPLSW